MCEFQTFVKRFVSYIDSVSADLCCISCVGLQCFSKIVFFILHVVVVVPLLSHVWVLVTPWTEAHQASLSFTISWSLLKLLSIESMMPSNHLILSPPFPPALNLSQHPRVFSISSLHQVDHKYSPPSNSRKLQKTNIEFATYWHNICIVLGIVSNLEMS